MGMREEIINHWIEALSGVPFPVSSASDVFAALPKGAAGNMTVGGLVVCNVGEVFEKFLKPTDFPINSAKELVMLIINRAGI